MTTTPEPGQQERVEFDPDATPPQGIELPGTAGSLRPRHAGPPARRAFPGQSGMPGGPPGGWSSAPSWAPRINAVPVGPGQPAPEPAASAGSGRSGGSGGSGASGGVPAWLFGIALLALATVVGVLGFVTPGFFVTSVLDQVAVQNGVRTVLQHDYQLANVADVVCPAKQKVLPGRDFTCVARVDNAPARVRVVVQDRTGSYQVGRPA